jgi:ferritin-like metal-binding protein YciE
MTDASQQKIVQYHNEAQASEHALTRVLQSQIAMTPAGSFRSGLETHLKETRSHAERVGSRLADLGDGTNPLMAVVGITESLIGQALALTKTPWDLLRGSGGEEKLLKNAKDACATEALEIATYTAIARLARAVGDEETMKLAESILADEEKMLARLLREIPKLTEAVVRADLDGEGSYDLSTTGAADTARKAGRSTKASARDAKNATRRVARKARKVPGVAQAEGQVKGAVASEGDLAVSSYDALTAAEVTAKLSALSQIDLAKIDSYERRNQNRSTVLSRITALRGDEPWAGFDELTVSEIASALSAGDDDLATKVRAYERSHKCRAGVIAATEREHANA